MEKGYCILDARQGDIIYNKEKEKVGVVVKQKQLNHSMKRLVIDYGKKKRKAIDPNKEIYNKNYSIISMGEKHFQKIEDAANKK